MVDTKHIRKNGLSFDYPHYYDVGKYPDSDDVHKAIVALSKPNRECELYVMVYRKNKFDNDAKHNTSLIKEYLRLQNYNNITINQNLPYCFNANKFHNGSNIKTTIVFDFNHNDVIAIAGNLKPFSNYDCTKDMQIILETVHYRNITLIIIGVVSFILALTIFSPLLIVTLIIIVYLLKN